MPRPRQTGCLEAEAPLSVLGRLRPAFGTSSHARLSSDPATSRTLLQAGTAVFGDGW